MTATTQVREVRRGDSYLKSRLPWEAFDLGEMTSPRSIRQSSQTPHEKSASHAPDQI